MSKHVLVATPGHRRQRLRARGHASMGRRHALAKTPDHRFRRLRARGHASIGSVGAHEVQIAERHRQLSTRGLGVWLAFRRLDTHGCRNTRNREDRSSNRLPAFGP